MKSATKHRKDQNFSSAHVVDGKLILSFPGALTPIVWQMDLAQTKASALEVRDNAGSYALFLKTPKGETVEVALFEQKADAVAGLVAASNALSQAHGQIRALSVASNGETQENHVPQNASKGFSWKTFILGALLIFSLLVVWSSLSAPTSGPANTQAGNAAAPAEAESGVPLSADQYLQKR